MFFFIVLDYSKNHYLLQNTKSKENTLVHNTRFLKTISSGFHNETKKGKLSEVTNTLRLYLNKQENSTHFKLFK